MRVNAVAQKFHGYFDAELIHEPKRVLKKKVTKHFIIKERQVIYRFYPHFHPYVGQLTQRLIQGSISGLQAADTEYVPNGMALPESIEISIGAISDLDIPPGTQIALLSDTQASILEGPPILLAAKLQLRLPLKEKGTMPTGFRAVLLEGLEELPSRGEDFNLPRVIKAVISAETQMILPNPTRVSLRDGTAILPSGTQVLLLERTEISLPGGTPATLIGSKPRPVLYEPIFSSDNYKPSALVERPYPVKDLDFTSGGPYSVYNWELFFHVPLTIAINLSKNQRFAEAQRWFHYLFDPTDDSDGPTPERFWKVRPFQSTDVKKIEEILINLSTGADTTLRNETIRSIEAWKSAPFRPHVIARYRQQAYMYKTVMSYLDNLISWGDSLFRQDTGESIDEALMLYVLAASILGPRPQPVPKKGSLRPQTYANLRSDLDRFGNAMREIETDVPFDLMPFPSEGTADSQRLSTLRSLGKALYFCVPRNDNLLRYWDTVGDRLFKIHNSLNILGIYRQLPLFEPPIDPAMLARAAAAGLDVGAIISGVNQPLPLVRFQLLVQKAMEICQEVKSLGSNLLSAMEKEDNEAISILRSRHERVILEMVEQVRYAQWQEAVKSREGLLKSMASAIHRFTYYERQLGRKQDEIVKAIPDLSDLDKASLEKMMFAMKEPEMGLRDIEVDIAEDVPTRAQALNGGKLLSSHEVRESLLLEGAQLSSDVANILNTISSALHTIPVVKIHGQPMGVGGTAETGGPYFGWGLAATANAAKAVSERLNFEARRASRIDNFARREQDWAFQSNLAAGEITQIYKQIRAAQIREAIAEFELKNHRQQIKHAREIESFLNEEGIERTGKKTNKALYAWMKREVKGIYSQCFQLAYDMARKAERALQHELGNPELSYLQFGYLAGREGLLAGEKLYLDIKRMEMAYLELNQREYELTKHVSLLQLDPMALLQLRMTGRCTVRLPEALFDMDGPGHYFRRIKTLAVSIPCVTGPYASVSCTLTLMKSSIRKTPAMDGGYVPENAEDRRFSSYFGSLQSIVTSSSQNDSGMFETNLHDERYLPFEGAGVISEWQLELPANPSKGDPCQFDYETISDVILHVRYTAREGGRLLRSGATRHVMDLIDNAQIYGSVRLFSVRHEFPTEWAKFQNQTPPDDKRLELLLSLRPEHYPFWSQGRLNSVKGVGILADSPSPSLEIFASADKSDNTKDILVKDPSLGRLFAGNINNIPLPASPIGENALKIYFEERNIKDLWIAIIWGK